MSAAAAQVIPFPVKRVEGEVWEAWISEDKLARYFDVSQRTIRRWRQEGMPSELFRGSRRYRLSDCKSWHRERSAYGG